MKKILALILALMLVTVVTAGVVMADEAVEATEVPEATQPAIPEGFDESTIVQHMIFDFTKQEETVAIENYLTANEATVNYFAEIYGAQQPMEIVDYNGQKALSLGSSELERTKLYQAGVGCIENEGFFADKSVYLYVCGDMLDQGYEDGATIAVINMKGNSNTESYEIIAGRDNSFVFVDYTFNWLYILIAIMGLIVLVLLAVIVIVASKKKKVVDALETEILDEDFAFEAFEDVKETSEEPVEETEEAVEEIVEEIVEEVVEETEEDK